MYDPDGCQPPPVFTPDTEPYLGRALLHAFDQVIVSCLEANEHTAAYTHRQAAELTDLQRAACEIIPQGISLVLSVRELVRQGYLFAALVLLRSVIERAGVISYIREEPDGLRQWRDGWKHRDRPSLARMLVSMSPNCTQQQAEGICALLNHAVHGDPIGAAQNLVHIDGRGPAHSSSKMLNNPELCDFICQQALCYLIVLMGRMAECFPGAAAHGRLRTDTGP